MIEIRKYEPKDVETYYALGQQLDRESKLMMLEPGERNWGVEKQKENLETFLSLPTSTMLLALDGERAVGYVGAQGNKFQRVQHVIHISIGVLSEYSGRGIGRRLMTELETWAKGAGIHRIELTTMEHNKTAQHLYTTLGFQSEGVRRHALKVDGAWVNEIAMAKLI